MVGAATSELYRTSNEWAHSGRPLTRKGRSSQQRRMLMPSWVSARKGKRETPEIKARFVGRKFAERDGRDGEVFAGNPELTVVRRLLTTHCTTRHGSATRVRQASRLETRQTNLLVVRSLP